MKRTLSIALTLCMALSLFTVSANAATPKPGAVVVSPQSLMVDGAVKNAQKYNIDGANYFKLRDLAYLLNGTGSQFGVGWDGATGTVTITTGEAYTSVGGELEAGADMSASAVASAQTIKINGETRSDLYVYNIGGANFFKLRDLGTALGFEVDYDAANNAATVATAPAEPPVMTTNVTGRNYKIDASGNLTVTGQYLYLADINIAGDFTVPSGKEFRQIIMSNVNVGGTIKVQNKNTTLWTDGKAAEVVISAESCSVTARDGVKVTEASGAKDSIICKTNANALTDASMSANGDLVGIPDDSGFSLALVSGEDILTLGGWGNRKPGSVVNVFSSLLNRAVTDKGFGKLTVDRVIVFGPAPTSYPSRYSLGAAKVLSSKSITVTEGAPVHISVTKAESGKFIVKATTPSELNENATYRISYGSYGYQKRGGGGAGYSEPYTAAQLIEGVETDTIGGPAEGKLAFVCGWYVNSNGEVVLSDGYSVGVKAPN